MIYLRGIVQFAIPLTGDVPIDAKPIDVLNKLPEELRSKVPAIRDGIRLLKKYSSKINEGKPNEETITIASWHICRHEEDGISCADSEQEI